MFKSLRGLVKLGTEYELFTAGDALPKKGIAKAELERLKSSTRSVDQEGRRDDEHRHRDGHDRRATNPVIARSGTAMTSSRTARRGSDRSVDGLANVDHSSMVDGDTGKVILVSKANGRVTAAVGAITRDANGAATSAPVVWSDGTTGTYTATTVSTTFPGAVDAYTITKGATTYTQPAVTRDAAGAVTLRPAIT